MTRSTATKRDRAFLQHRSFELRLGYRVGSYFKGCEHCGDTITIETARGGRRVWLSGYQVYRIYQPSRHGYMYWCYECGAIDLQCWSLSDTNIAYAMWLASRSEVRR